ncbi:MAG: S-layer homology domain-containing protein [Clostridia bacterium]|nr:S-layer homology domain-containing protein [Clostridia bacterium]
MKRKKFLKRTFVWMMALVMLSGMLAAVPARADGNDMTAYRITVQKLVDTYGVYHYDENITRHYPGVSSVEVRDITGDGRNELLVSYVKPSITEYEDEVSFVFEVYTYKDGAASLLTSIPYDYLGNMHISVVLKDGKCIIEYGTPRVSSTAKVWNGRRFEEVAVFDDATRAQLERINEAGQGGGLVAEDGEIMNVLYELCGVSDVSESDHIYTISNWITPINVARGTEVVDLASSLSALGIKAPMMKPEDALDMISYCGSATYRKMTSKMAKAYLEVLRSIDNGDAKVVLVDVADDGLPIMLVDGAPYRGIGVYGYDGEKAIMLDYHKDMDMISYATFGMGYFNGRATLHIGAVNLDPGDAYGDFWYAAEDAQFTKVHGVRYVYGENSWEREINGKKVEEFYNDDYEAYDKHLFQDMIDGEFRLVGDWTPITTAREALKIYAEGISPYPDFDKVTVDNDAYAEAVAKAAAEALGGTVTGIYKITDGLYYVIIEIDGGEKGALVKGVRTDGTISWSVTQKDDSPISAADLGRIAVAYIGKPNMTVDFGKISSFKKIEDLSAYLEELLKNIDGIAPNAGAKTQLITLIENSIVKLCTKQISGKSDKLTVTGENVADLVKKAEEIRGEIDRVMENSGINSADEITVIIRVVWKNYKENKPCKIVLDSSLVDALGGNDLQLMLGKTDCYVKISNENLKALMNEYEELRISIEKEGKNKYAIVFKDGDGHKIEKMIEPVTIALPAEDILSTVMMTYAGGSDNWGGQYDANTKILAFDARYSGEYEILKQDINILDIDGLSEESREAIRFMVSKGYLELHGDAFEPGGPLTRYQFTKALVGMFFALDRELATTFTDVPEDSAYYPFVASAEAFNIVEGIEPTLFGGDINITVEQMLTLCARTLVEQKGASLPTDASPYLLSFSDRGNISEWAVPFVAMAVRDGLFDQTDVLNPQSEINREQAAVILYRLFRLLYEVPPIDIDAAPVSPIVIALIGGAGVAAIGGGSATVVLLRRRKRRIK